MSDAARVAGIDADDFAHHWVINSAYPSSPTNLLLARLPDIGDYLHIDQLARYDLTTNKMTPIAVPSEMQSSLGGLELGFSETDEPTLMDTLAIGGYERVLAVYHGEAWIRDPAVRRGAFGIRPFFGLEAATGLEGIDATGATVWTDKDLTSPSLQSMSIGTDGGVTVATVCTAANEISGCPTFALVGVSTDNGELLWSLPGLRLVPAHADGYVLTTDGSIFDAQVTPGWVLINDKTGTLVDKTQHWSDPDAFRYGCCGESEFVSVRHFGGVVITVNNTRLSVWYPKVAAGEPHALSIP